MGPLVYTSGNLTQVAFLDVGVPLQWGRWFTPAETEAYVHGLDGRRTRFNGAAGLHQRKQGAA